MRNISFALTTEQFKNKTKTVTRRWGWKFIKPGDVLMGCKKTMGFKKGEKIERFHPIEIINVRREPLNSITKEDCIKEGFPEFEPQDFIEMLVDSKHLPSDEITRIEFKHLSEKDLK